MYTPPKKKGPRRVAVPYAGKIRLRVGDTVRVLSGKDKDKEGTVSRILPKEGKVVVDGVNMIVKHKKAQPRANMSAAAAAHTGGRIEMAAPLPVGKVQLVDKGKEGAVTRIGVRVDEKGEKVRYAKKSGKVIENA